MTFSLFTIDTDYCDYLRKYDSKVPYNKEDKESRPFLGIVIDMNGFDYYAPLTSPKPKHKQMKNAVDFMKIDGGELGAINLNNMIPVNIESLSKISLKISSSDNISEMIYKKLLSKQLSWCESNREIIMNRASKLYGLIVSGKAWNSLINRTCDFVTDEKYCLKFKEENSLKP